MRNQENVADYLPLTEATYYILLMLVEPTHGYDVMQQVEARTGGTVTIGPGTLYGAFSTLEQQGLIRMVGQENRRKIYTLTDRGRAALAGQIERLDMMVHHGRELLGGKDL